MCDKPFFQKTSRSKNSRLKILQGYSREEYILYLIIQAYFISDFKQNSYQSIFSVEL